MEELRYESGIAEQPLHARVWRRPSADQLLVLMPAAVSKDSPNRHPAFSRWRWADRFPDTHIVAFADPSMGMSDELRGAWFLHPEIDVLEAIARRVRTLAKTVGARSVLIYGSSLGGFGALSIAALVPGAKALAEVPQLDFARWRPGAVADVERYLLGVPLEEHRERHPHQVSVQSRFERAGRIPPYVIVTNVREDGFDEQLAFHRWVVDAELQRGTDPKGHELRVISDVVGHRALGPVPASALILEQLRTIAA
jgi:pimeloyl-ACP methyl ester carboxylesterase